MTRPATDGPPDLRIVIADDSALIREGIARLIEESGGTVVAAVSLIDRVAPREVTVPAIQ